MPSPTLRPALMLFVGLSLMLAACDGENPEAAPSSVGSARSGDPTGTPSSDGPGWVELDESISTVPLAAGDYALRPNGSARKLAVVRAEAGWQHYQAWTFVSGEEFTTGQPFRAMGYLTTDEVFADPCGSSKNPADKDATVFDPGPGVADLADALAAQKGAVPPWSTGPR